MNFLALCNALAQEAGVNGDPALSGVVAQTGELKRIVDWTQGGLQEILGTKLWNFLWENPTLTLPFGANAIAGSIPASRWDKDQTWTVEPTGTPPRNLDYVPWRQFSEMYRILLTDGNMTAWTIRPDNAIVFNAKSADPAGSPINVERWKNPVPLADANDVPPLPEDLHMLIVWTALKKYAGYDEAGNQRSIAIDEMKRMKESLYARCLPEMEMGGSLLDNY